MSITVDYHVKSVKWVIRRSEASADSAYLIDYQLCNHLHRLKVGKLGEAMSFVITCRR